MAKEGEDYLKKIIESQEYQFEKIGNEDIYAFKDIIGIVIEEKDWKDPTEVFKNNIYSRGKDGTRYKQMRSQVVNYGYKIMKRNMERNMERVIYRNIICVFVISNLVGRVTYPIFFHKFGTIFVVHKTYFPAWLKSIERIYLGEPSIYTPNMFMGGK